MKPLWYLVTQNKIYEYESSMGIEKHFNRYVNL